MNILDINNLPTLTLKVTGRNGVPSEAWVINQEEKNKVIVTDADIVYTQGETLVITLTDTDFISSIVEDTTLSVILMAEQSVPLYRDIVKFTGELGTSELYSQYDTSSDYYIYEDND